jgi:hypothetical protein
MVKLSVCQIFHQVALISIVAMSTAWGQCLPEQTIQERAKSSINEGECFEAKEDATPDGKVCVSAKFVSCLLSGSIPHMQPTSRGICLRHCKVIGNLNVSHIKINHIVRFENVEFTGPVEFSGHFYELLSFERCTFKASVKFDNISVADDLVLDEAMFYGPVSFARMHIAGNVHADHITFFEESNPIDYSGTIIGQSAYFRRSIFSAPVDFSSATVSGALVFNETTFKSVDFSRIKVGRSLLMNQANFDGNISLRMANVDGSLEAIEGRFLNSRSILDLTAICVEQVVSFKAARFYSTIRGTAARIGNNLELNKAYFHNLKGSASFHGIQVGGYVLMNNITSDSLVNFTGSIIGKNFEAKKCSFNHKEVSIKLVDIAVQQHILLDGSIFEGAIKASNVTVNGLMSFSGATLSKDVDICNSEMDYLAFVGTRERMKLPNLDLSDCQIARKMDIHKACIGMLLARSLVVHGEANIFETIIEKKLDLSWANVNHLSLSSNNKLLSPTENNTLHGVKFRSISYKTENGPDSHEELVAFLAKFQFSPDVYNQLEKYYKEKGKSEAAKVVRINQKNREGGLWNWVLGVTVSHGTEPWRAFLAVIVILGISCGVFWKKELFLPMTDIKTIPWYNPLIYSLDLITPVIDLKMVNHWTPVKAWRCICARVVIILGWILIPIGMAAFTGILK